MLVINTEKPATSAAPILLDDEARRRRTGDRHPPSGQGRSVPTPMVTERRMPDAVTLNVAAVLTKFVLQHRLNQDHRTPGYIGLHDLAATIPICARQLPRRENGLFLSQREGGGETGRPDNRETSLTRISGGCQLVSDTVPASNTVG